MHNPANEREIEMQCPDCGIDLIAVAWDREWCHVDCDNCGCDEDVELEEESEDE